MEEKRVPIALFLSILVIMIYTELTRPVDPIQPKEATKIEKQTEQRKTVRTSAPTTVNERQEAVVTPAPANPVSSLPSPDEYLKAQVITVETPLVRAKVSTLGARLISYQLKKHKVELGSKDLYEMVKAEGAALPLGIKSGGFYDDGVSYALSGLSADIKEVKANTYQVDDNQNLSLNFTGTFPDGRTVTKTIEFVSNNYVTNVNVNFSAPASDGSKIWLQLNEINDPDDEGNRYNLNNFVYLDDQNSIERDLVTDSKLKLKERESKWMGIGDHYFTSIVSSNSDNNSYGQEEIGEKTYYAIRSESNTPTAGSYKIYLGPKIPEHLKEAGRDLQRSIDLGWFAMVGQPILAGIQFFYNLLGNYGLAIIAVTLLIKIILLPLTKTSFKSMKAMQDIQPEMQAIRKRIKDPTELNKAVMDLYKRKGVNPMGGCLPLILQIPVFLGMYNALQSSVHLRHAEFALWINDLASPEKLVILGIPVPMMILLMGASMYVQQLTMPTAITDPMQKKIMTFMPIMFTVMFIIFPFPSGLVLYWLINNVISIVQQYVLRSEKEYNPYSVTLVASLIVFAVSYVLTLV